MTQTKEWAVVYTDKYGSVININGDGIEVEFFNKKKEAFKYAESKQSELLEDFEGSYRVTNTHGLRRYAKVVLERSMEIYARSDSALGSKGGSIHVEMGDSDVRD